MMNALLQVVILHRLANDEYHEVTAAGSQLGKHSDRPIAAIHVRLLKGHRCGRGAASTGAVHRFARS